MKSLVQPSVDSMSKRPKKLNWTRYPGWASISQEHSTPLRYLFPSLSFAGEVMFPMSPWRVPPQPAWTARTCILNDCRWLLVPPIKWAVIPTLFDIDLVVARVWPPQEVQRTGEVGVPPFLILTKLDPCWPQVPPDAKLPMFIPLSSICCPSSNSSSQMQWASVVVSKLMMWYGPRRMPPQGSRL